MQTPSLKPEVTGRLADQEKAAIAAVRAGEKVRPTLSLDPVIALAAIRAAAIEDRDLSGFVGQVLKEYESRNPAPAAGKKELFAKIDVAINRQPKLTTQIVQLIRKANRTKRSVA